MPNVYVKSIEQITQIIDSNQIGHYPIDGPALSVHYR